LEPNVDPYGAWSRVAHPTTLSPGGASLSHPRSRRIRLALVAVGLLAFGGLARVTGSWLVLAGSLLALSGLGNELVRRR
jgi:hypothetical protein